MPRSLQDLRADDIRAGMHQRQHILELVAEPESPAGLIQCSATPQTTGERLVEQPAVKHQVRGGVRRFHRDGIQDLIPLFLEGLPGGFHLPGCLHPPDQRQAFLPIRSFAQQEKDLLLRAGRQVNVQLDGGARVQPGIHCACQSDPPEGSRSAHAPHASQEFRPVGGHAMRSGTRRQKCHPFAKLTVVAVAGEQRIFIRVEFRTDMGLLNIARCCPSPIRHSR